jgi:nitrate reductase gamma subunit
MTTDLLLFGIFPYIAVALAIVVTCLRYCNDRFSYSSLSSQFLESKQLFWGAVTWHYGIMTILTIHVIGFLLPRSILA